MDDAPTDPLARDVIAHSCSTCSCSGVENTLQRNRSSSSEASVGTGTSYLLPTGSEPSGGSVRSGARNRGGPAGSGGGGLAPSPPANGQHVLLDVGLRSRRSLARDASEEEEEEEEDDDELCPADLVATNLEELNSGNHPKLKLAFDDWEKTYKTFQERREYKEAQRDAIRNEIYQVLGFYIVFQGVIITAVAQASTLRCKNWWTSFLLSLLTSLVTVGVVLQKLSEIVALETTIASVKSSAKVLQTRINEVKLSVGPRYFNFRINAKDGRSKDLIVPGFAVNGYRTSQGSPRDDQFSVMSHTDIINKTKRSLKLKVGNNLVFTDLTVVQKDGSYRVYVDPNATYQEYLMGKDRNGRPLIISSDDCADNKSITVLEDDDGNFTTSKKPRNSVKTVSAAPSSSSGLGDHGNGKPGGGRLWRFFSSFRFG